MTKQESAPSEVPQKTEEIALPLDYKAPETKYFTTKDQLAAAVGRDFIEHANKLTRSSDRFLVGLAHGRSPSAAYEYIIEHYHEIKRPDLIRYTFVNSPLRRQRNLKNVVHAGEFLKKLLKKGLITTEHILGTTLNRDVIEQFAKDFNNKLDAYLAKHNKEGLDYAFLVTDSSGRVAGITRTSPAFESTDYLTVVEDRKEKEITVTPHFLSKTKRIAFLATKSDKRRPLAWLYYRWGKRNESPSFLRYIERVDKRMTVFVDDLALTWPDIVVERKTRYGVSTIRVDLAKPYNEDTKRKLPVVLLVHGFLGLNSFDGLLTSIPSHQYLAAAMHYGSIPNNLPISEYSKHIVRNIDAVVSYFGERGHPVYIFDHSMGNIYFLMIDRDFQKLEGVKKYLKGRIGANPFFGEEAKHALVGFLDNVIIPSFPFMSSITERTFFSSFRRIVPLDSKKGVRKRGINITEWLISKESAMRERIWKAMKERILYLMSNIDSLPHLNRIPIEQALNRLPAKVFAIQVHSALEESKAFDKQTKLANMTKNNIPVLILKSERDIVAKFVPRIYQDGQAEIIDITNYEETDLFREHLYHMINPLKTMKIIDEFITRTEEF